MLRFLARLLHKSHHNCPIIACSSTNTVDLYASIWPQTTRFNTRREYSRLATSSMQQWNTCYGRDGTIASKSINQENNIEALVIFKKIQFAVGLPNRYEFYSGAKKNERQRKKWTRTYTTFPPQKVKTRKFSGRFTLQSCKSTARKCTRKCAVIRPIVVFHSSGQEHPTTVFCKISVWRSKFCLEFSFTWLKIFRWPFHSCKIFEAHLILLINSLWFSEV